MEELSRFEKMVRNSNLVATAGEFVPKSLRNLDEMNQLQLPAANEVSSNEGFRFTGQHEESGMPYKNNDDFSPPTERPHFAFRDWRNVASTSGYQPNLFNDTKKPDSTQYFPGPHNNKYVEFSCGRGDGRYFKQSHQKPGDKWKKPHWNGNKNRYYDPEKGKEQDEKESKQYQRVKLNQKENDLNYNPSKGRQFGRAESHYYKFKDKNRLKQSSNESWNKHEGKTFGINQQHHEFSKYKHRHLANKRDAFSEHCDTDGDSSEKSNENNIDKYPKEITKAGDNKNWNVKLISESAQVTNQREQLIDLLLKGVLECLVCCEQISQCSSIWSCSNCYHVLHLKCIIKWAKSSKGDFGWRCPACQNVTNDLPKDYYCFCGKVKNPEWNRQDYPHSCGEVCGKSYRKWCPHRCTLLCHPGPCPQCTATITKSCGCEKTTKTVQCFDSEKVVCDKVCGKELNCLIHTCEAKCHAGKCEDCDRSLEQDCYCRKNHRKIKCSVEVIGCSEFSCGSICQKKLNCGNHACALICHEGECPKCELTPEIVKSCACGQTDLTSLNIQVRNSCADPIPTCELICGKVLSCGPAEKHHTCKSKCHQGPCPVCTLETTVKCRCGQKNKTVSCSQLKAQTESILCDKRCTKKRSCGKHKCNQLCCIGIDHVCPLPCNRFLQCGLHRCEDTCHRGHCKPCLRASFEELSCECGAEVIFPPVPCGTRRPPCEKPCTRIHSCEHPPVHSCHSENQCPPCTVLTKKYCHGRHELRKAVPCHVDSFSCGLPCGKELPCGRHKCILSCHSGLCLQQEQNCSQPCTVLRADCGHICGTPCHDGSCPPEIPCKEMVRVTCECGHRYMTRGCHENAKEYQRIATAKLATKMADLQAGQRIDLNDFAGANKKMSYKTLDCDDECKLIGRNRRLAIALQIRNPDLSAKLTPRYSEYLKNWAKRDPRFCQMVHEKLTDLVQLAKQSKQKCRSYSFDPMNREKRHFIHEYCDHFGCESVAYDQEPKRNVVATAIRDKSWLPSVSIIEFLQKENSPRKVPMPVIAAKSSATTPQRAMEILPSKILGNSQQSETAVPTGDSSVDYFDWRQQSD